MAADAPRDLGVGDWAAEDVRVLLAVEGEQQQCGMQREDEDLRFDVADALAAVLLHPAAELFPRGHEDVALDGLAELLVLQDAPQQQARNVGIGGEVVEHPPDRRFVNRARTIAARSGRQHRVARDLDQLVVDVLEHRVVERLLRCPVIVQAGDVDAGLGGDLAGRGALESLGREDFLGGFEDPRFGRRRDVAHFA